MRSIIVFLVIFMSGCAFNEVPPTESTWQPRMPEPYLACTAEPVVIIHEGIPYVGFTYADSLEKALCEERAINYIIQLQEILCYYKKDCYKEANDTPRKPK